MPWWRLLGVAIVSFAITRLIVVATAAARGAQVVIDAAERHETLPWGPNQLITNVFTQWDGLWYLKIATMGYPRDIPPNITFHQDEARAAFYPLYPMIVRYVDRLLPGGVTFAAIALTTVLALAATVLIGRLVLDMYGDQQIAERAMLLFVAFPGAVVLSYTYAEALLILLAVCCLLLLRRERWLAAGLVAALATATRPNGLAVAAACLVAAVIAVVRTGEKKPLIAPALAPLGFVGFHAFLAWHTAEPAAWWRVQREAWEEGWSFGWAALLRVGDFFSDPLGSPTSTITVATLAALAIAIWAAHRHPLPLEQVAYCAVIVVLMLAPSTVTARPRFLLTAFPLLFAVAAWLPRRRELGGELLLLVCGGGLAALAHTYAVYAAIP